MSTEKTRAKRDIAGSRPTNDRVRAAATHIAPPHPSGNHSESPAQLEELANVLPRRISGLARMLYGASGSAIPRGMRSVLFALAAEPLQISQIARQEGIGQSAATRMVARLEALGLVRRDRSPGDRRVVMVSVTARGRTELEHMREQSRRVMREVLRDRTAKELRQLSQASEALDLLAGLIHGRADNGRPEPARSARAGQSAKPRQATRALQPRKPGQSAKGGQTTRPGQSAKRGQSTRAASSSRNTRRALPS